MNSHTILPIPLRSLKSLTFPLLTDLFKIYFEIQYIDTLIFSISKGRCFIVPWSETSWKFLFHVSWSIAWFTLYGRLTFIDNCLELFNSLILLLGPWEGGKGTKVGASLETYLLLSAEELSATLLTNTPLFKLSAKNN